MPLVPTPQVTNVLVNRFALPFAPVQQRNPSQGGRPRTGDQLQLLLQVSKRLPLHRQRLNLKAGLVRGGFFYGAERLDLPATEVAIDTALRRGDEVVLWTPGQHRRWFAGNRVLTAYRHEQRKWVPGRAVEAIPAGKLGAQV